MVLASLLSLWFSCVVSVVLCFSLFSFRLFISLFKLNSIKFCFFNCVFCFDMVVFHEWLLWRFCLIRFVDLEYHIKSYENCYSLDFELLKILYACLSKLKLYFIVFHYLVIQIW